MKKLGALSSGMVDALLPLRVFYCEHCRAKNFTATAEYGALLHALLVIDDKHGHRPEPEFRLVRATVEKALEHMS